MQRSSFVIEDRPELVFALVRAIGTDLEVVSDHLKELCRDAGWQLEPIRISDHFRDVEFLKGGLKSEPEDERYRTHMNAGDLLRSYTKRGDAVALLGVDQIRQEFRKKKYGPEFRGRAFLLRSLMHPDEVASLRAIYGPELFVISVFSPEVTREKELAKKIGKSRGQNSKLSAPHAKRLINRDAGILDPTDEFQEELLDRLDYLLDVRKTFHKADLFISTTLPDESRQAVERFVHLVFGYPFHTPTLGEFAMSVAYQAALRSGSLARPVGAAIMTKEGEIASVGANALPRVDGGIMGAEDYSNVADSFDRSDPSDVIRREHVTDFVRRIFTDRRWLTKLLDDPDASKDFLELGQKDPNRVVDALLQSLHIRGAEIFDVIEYGPEVHAEMTALVDASRRGITIKGGTLYCTTFPCHICARLIVASGISEVVYIEPYPKSKVEDLYGDSVSIGEKEEETGNKVSFKPFVGVAPRRISQLFSWLPRKVDDLSGRTSSWSIGTATVRKSILDQESVESGANSARVQTLEEYFVEAFKLRLNEADEELKKRQTNVQEESGNS